MYTSNYNDPTLPSKTAEKGRKVFRFEPVPSSLGLRSICHHPLDTVKPLANTVARLEHSMKKQREEKKKDHPLRKTPYRRIPRNKVDYYTGSSYSGEWNYLGMEGVGIYKFPDGTSYVGEMKNGLFSGCGALRFPNGGSLEGRWTKGELVNGSYMFQDGFVYNPSNWEYCRMPDRRFYSEIVEGLKPSGNIQMGSDHPAPSVWPGCLDAVEGFYRLKTKELINVKTGKVIRIVNKPEEEWIIKKCRRHGELSFPFNPSLYENWFQSCNKDSNFKENALWNSVVNKKNEDHIGPRRTYSSVLLRGHKKCTINRKSLFN